MAHRISLKHRLFSAQQAEHGFNAGRERLTGAMARERCTFHDGDPAAMADQLQCSRAPGRARPENKHVECTD